MFRHRNEWWTKTRQQHENRCVDRVYIFLNRIIFNYFILNQEKLCETNVVFEFHGKMIGKVVNDLKFNLLETCQAAQIILHHEKHYALAFSFSFHRLPSLNAYTQRLSCLFHSNLLMQFRSQHTEREKARARLNRHTIRYNFPNFLALFCCFRTRYFT